MSKTKKNKARKNKTRNLKPIKKTKIDINFDLCNNKYCTDLTKDSAQYKKDQSIKCPKTLSSDEWNKCDSNFYNASNYKKLFYKNIECTKQYCAKERNDRARQYDNVPISKKDMTYWLNLLKKVKK